jgi:hypothetical protein
MVPAPCHIKGAPALFIYNLPYSFQRTSATKTYPVKKSGEYGVFMVTKAESKIGS